MSKLKTSMVIMIILLIISLYAYGSYNRYKSNETKRIEAAQYGYQQALFDLNSKYLSELTILYNAGYQPETTLQVYDLNNNQTYNLRCKFP